MIVMPEELKEIMNELKISNSETYFHSIHVKAYVYKMLKCMNNTGITSYSDMEFEHILKGALLHDVGKLCVENFILTKNSYLTEDEKEEMTEHTRLGFDTIKDYLNDDEYEIIKNICLYHHERTDGNGYEKKKDLPLYVQVVAICDIYDALTSDRIYREKISTEDALEMIETGKCGHFDAEIIDFLKGII